MNGPFEHEPVFSPALGEWAQDSDIRQRNAYLESRMETFYGVASEVAGGDQVRTEEFFQEICLRALEVLSDPELLAKHKEVKVHDLARAMELELSEPHIESFEELGIDIPGTRDEASEPAIRSIDSEIFVDEKLPKLVGERALGLLKAHILDGKSTAELGVEQGVSANRINQILNDAKNRIRLTNLAKRWAKTFIN